MRYLLIFLTVVTILIRPDLGSTAEELYLIRIESVDRQTGNMTFTILEGPDSLNKTERREPLNEPENETVIITNQSMALEYSKGDTARVWGDRNGPDGQFRIKRILSAQPSKFSKDPSGVRRRLKQHMGWLKRPGR